MLVEFQRVVTQQVAGSGEDDGLSTEGEPLPIAVNPLYVASLTPSTEMPNAVVLKLSDGRGYSIRGTYAEILERLQAQGGSVRH